MASPLFGSQSRSPSPTSLSSVPGFQVKLLGYGLSYEAALSYCRRIGKDQYATQDEDGNDIQLPEDDYLSLAEMTVEHIRQQLSFEPRMLQARMGFIADTEGVSTTIMVITLAVAYRGESEPMIESDWDYERDEVAGKVLRERSEAVKNILGVDEWPLWWRGDAYSLESESEVEGGLEIVKKL